MENVLLVLNIIIAIILVLLILMQKSEGGALGIGVSQENFMLSRTTGNFMTKATAIVATLLNNQILDFQSIFIAILIGSAIGAILAKRVEMTSMPQLVALFNGFGGAASLLVATAEFYRADLLPIFIFFIISSPTLN